MRIKNKFKRQEIFDKMKSEKSKLKLKRRQQIKKEETDNPLLKEIRLIGLKNNVPKTIDNTREKDDTMVLDDEEILEEEETDEFASYFNGQTPNILVTTSRRPTSAVYEFAEEFILIFPNAKFVKRSSKFEVKQIVDLAIEKGFTDLFVHVFINYQDAITMIHLPNGPTAHFKLSSIKNSKEIQGHGRMTAHTPELILNNFHTRMGHTIGRMFASLFPQVPEFKGRQVATFHNQRDFIFFRRHRYIFKDGKRCNLQELGPRFTLKLRWLQNGTFDTKHGDFEWVFKPNLETSRRKFFL